MSTDITLALLMICSIYLAGRIAERRGRSFKIWAWIAAIIGPLALPLVFMFPILHGKDGDNAGCGVAAGMSALGHWLST